jgi:hypothetical protein
VSVKDAQQVYRKKLLEQKNWEGEVKVWKNLCWEWVATSQA